MSEETNPLRELQELMDKIKSRTKRIQESTQNPPQASLDALYSDVVDAYWALNAHIDSLKVKDSE